MFYSIIKLNIFNKLKESFAFSFNNKYLVNIFHNIIPNTKAAEISIAKKNLNLSSSAA